MHFEHNSKPTDGAKHMKCDVPAPFFSSRFISDARYRPGDKFTKSVRDMFPWGNDGESVDNYMINTPQYIKNKKIILMKATRNKIEEAAFFFDYGKIKLSGTDLQ